MMVDVSFVTSGHDVADARLHREVAALRRAGLQVEVLGLGDAADGPVGALVRTWPRVGGLRRAWSALRLPWLTRGRVIIALDPDTTAGTWVMRAMVRCSGRLRGRRPPLLVADVHEDYGLVLRDRAWASGLRGIGGRFWAVLGRAAAQRADLTVVADEHLMPDVPDRVVLPNLPDLTMVPPPGDRGPVPRAIYVGDLRRSRGLFSMLDAVAAAPAWTLDLVGPIADRDRVEADARMTAPNLDGRVRWHDRLPPYEAWKHARGAWVGLLLLDDTPAFRDAVPSKLYEYLASGLAVVTTDLPRSAALVTEAGAGVVVSGASSAADALTRWATDVSLVDKARAGARAFAAQLPSEPAAGFARAVGALLTGPGR